MDDNHDQRWKEFPISNDILPPTDDNRSNWCDGDCPGCDCIGCGMIVIVIVQRMK